MFLWKAGTLGEVWFMQKDRSEACRPAGWSCAWGRGMWIRDGGLSEQNLGEAGSPHPPPPPGMVRKGLTGFQSQVDASGDLGFLSWLPGKRVCGFRGQLTLVMPF